MGLTFNLHSGAALQSMMDGIAKKTADIVKKTLHGYSSDIVSDAVSKGAKIIKDHPLNDLTRAELSAVPAINALKAGVVFSSANWTGRDFDGFTKPKTEVMVHVVDTTAKQAGIAPPPFRPRGLSID